MFAVIRPLMLGSLAVLFSFNCLAQIPGKASANISANISVPVSISKYLDLDIQMDHTTVPGTQILTPTDTRSGITGTRSIGDKLFQAAAFRIGGEYGFTYSVTLTMVPVTISNGKASMKLSRFTSFPAVNGIIGATAQPLYLGASLEVQRDQAPGRYSATAPVVVVVNYN